MICFDLVTISHIAPYAQQMLREDACQAAAFISRGIKSGAGDAVSINVKQEAETTGVFLTEAS